MKDIVELPRQHAITRDRIPTPDELRDILVVSKPRGKALIAALASSGMRIGESLSLRIKDIDFDKHPTLVHLSPEVTKDRQERWCFISDEATAFLREYLNDRLGASQSYVFLGRHQGIAEDGKGFKQRREGQAAQLESKPITYWDADFMVSTALRNAGLTEKDDHGRDRIHIHSLRKFFFTRMLSILGRELTEALMGHKEYLDAAYLRYLLRTFSRESSGMLAELVDYLSHLSQALLTKGSLLSGKV